VAVGFRHEACFYDGRRGFVDAVAPFVRAGVLADEAVLVVVDAPKIGWLRDALGSHADRVRFADMSDVGHNPARIIPAWARFMAEATDAGRGARGVGEPIGATRTSDELRECHVHESLLNKVFGAGRPWWLLCPYDTASLAPAVLEEARRTHPFVDESPSDLHEHVGDHAYLAVPLPEPGDVVLDREFDSSGLRDVRATVRELAEEVGVGDRVTDVVLAVNELATNSVEHGGGHGRLRAWHDDARGALVLEVHDRGRIADPLVGRIEPPISQIGGRGLWLCNQLCDLVQVRSTVEGTTVRLHVGAPLGAYVSR
jgi:anti-sigma regulatory factor (Ser/Thr protein kinase)